VIVDPLNELVLNIDQLRSEDGQTIQKWIDTIADTVGTQVLGTDDANALKQATNQSGLVQKVCKAMWCATPRN
jgi:hypothetical protein